MTNKKAALEKKIQQINDKEKQLKAQLRAIDAKEREASRKKETRAKIIIGGFIVAHAKRNESRFIELFDQAFNESIERDKKTLSEYRALIK